METGGSSAQSDLRRPPPNRPDEERRRDPAPALSAPFLVVTRGNNRFAITEDFMLPRPLIAPFVLAVSVTVSHGNPAAAEGLQSPQTPAVDAPFDIVTTDVTRRGGEVVFRVKVRGKAGALRPKVKGQFAGSAVYSYVWPTNLDSAQVGFDAQQGILALAVTFHPDFDDAAYGGVNRHLWHHIGLSSPPTQFAGPGS